MKKKRSMWFRAAACMIAVLILTLGSVSSVSAATNKALKLTKASFSDKTHRNNEKGAEMSAALLKKDKLKKTGMNFSAKVYFPVKALNEKDDMIFVDCYLYLQDAKTAVPKKRTGPSDQWPGYMGFVETKFDIVVQYNGKKLPTLMKRSWATGKFSKAGKYASIEKKGGYYILTLNKMPFSSKYYNVKMKEKPILTNRTYVLSPSVLLISETAKEWKGNLYADDLKVKSAKKTQTITFNKKDYKALYGSNWASGDVKCSIAKPMK